MNSPARPLSPQLQNLLQSALEHHQAGRLDEARNLYGNILEIEPRQVDSLHLLGVIQMSDGNYPAAIDNIQQAISIYGDRPQYFANLALAQENSGLLEEAETNARKAVEQDRNDPEFHNILGIALEAREKFDEAEKSYRDAIITAPDFTDSILNLGNLYRRRGELGMALAAYKKAVKIQPDNASGHFNMGLILIALERPDEAVVALHLCIELRPGNISAFIALATAYKNLGRLGEAAESYQNADQLEPDNPDVLINLGKIFNRLEMPEAALETARRVINVQPLKAIGYCLLADALITMGQADEAIEAYQQGIEREPSSVDVHAYQASLLDKMNRHEAAEVSSRKALAIEPHHPIANLVLARCEKAAGQIDEALARLENLQLDRKNVAYETPMFIFKERGDLHDRQGDYDKAFELYSRAGAKFEQSCSAIYVDKRIYLDRIDQLQERFTPDWLETWPESPPAERSDPVFLVGFPRSGTTLLEIILNAHSAVSTLDESTILSATIENMTSAEHPYPQCLADLPADGIKMARQTYFENLSREVGGLEGGRTYIDKNPLNMVEIGAVHRLFPAAKIILVLRHPCDSVLSCFIQTFRPDPSMANFASLAGATALYAKVMNLWDQYGEVLPLDIHTIRYEDLVTDLAGEIRSLLAHLGLEWEDSLLNYRDNIEGQFISTPSSNQVSQEIYSRSVKRWRNYEIQFEAILPTLQPFIDKFGY